MIVITTSLIISIIALLVSIISLALFVYIYRVHVESIYFIEEVAKSYAASAKMLDDLLREINKKHIELKAPNVSGLTEDKLSANLNESQDTAPQIHDSKMKVLLAAMEHEITARDVMLQLNVTREHASRLLAQLYTEGYLIRTNDKKPFKYIISDKGKSLLKG